MDGQMIQVEANHLLDRIHKTFSLENPLVGIEKYKMKYTGPVKPYSVKEYIITFKWELWLEN